MTRSTFRQADLERIMKAAKRTGSIVQIDLRTLVVTVLPQQGSAPSTDPTASFAPDGQENWD